MSYMPFARLLHCSCTPVTRLLHASYIVMAVWCGQVSLESGIPGHQLQTMPHYTATDVALKITAARPCTSNTLVTRERGREGERERERDASVGKRDVSVRREAEAMRG